MTLLLGFILLVAWSVALSIPAAFALMLFLGNLGLNISFIGCIPGAFVLRVLTVSFTRTKESN